MSCCTERAKELSAREGVRALLLCAISEPGGAQGTLDVGDRDQAHGPAELVDDHRPSDPRKGGPLEQRGDVLIPGDDQLSVAVGDLIHPLRSALPAGERLHLCDAHQSDRAANVVYDWKRRVTMGQEIVRGGLCGRGSLWDAHHGCGHQDRKSTRLNSSHLGISYAV